MVTDDTSQVRKKYSFSRDHQITLGFFLLSVAITGVASYIEDRSTYRKIENKRAEYNRTIEKLDNTGYYLQEAESLRNEISDLEEKLIFFYKSEK